MTSRRTLLSSLAAVAVLIFGAATGVLAMVTDSVQLLGVSVSSSNYDPPPEPEIQPVEAAVTEVASASTDCSTVTPGTSSAISVADQTIDLVPVIEFQEANPGSFPVGSLHTVMGYYCFTNVGDGSATMDVQLLARSTVEVGECGATEAAAEAELSDVSCAAGAEGELDRVLAVSLQSSPSDGMPQCPGLNPGAGTNATFHRGHNPGAVVPTYVVLGPGESCLMRLVITDFDNVAANVVRAAVSDTYSADLDIILTEQTP